MQDIINKFINGRKSLEGQTTVVTDGDVTYLYHHDYHTNVNYEVARRDKTGIRIVDSEHPYVHELQIGLRDTLGY